ncbi:glucoamylase family protein [Streptomyces sp. SAS_272]|uniref:glucoamylase family protein n=1 Tax=Streptomyces sp. SAS_272 TaxID=3412747 RepID=UPI00403D16BF
MTRHQFSRRAVLTATAALAMGAAATSAHASTAAHDTAPLTSGQRRRLRAIAADTWKYFAKTGVDQHTHLPLDNITLGTTPARGTYTSPTNIGINLWSIISAYDLGFISRAEQIRRLGDALGAIEKLRKWNGFLLSWYDTTSGDPITGPGGTSLDGKPLTGQFISTVDNGWYAASLVELRQAAPQFAHRATKLLDAMDFGVFYNDGDQSTNVNAGQMYGGYTVDQGPASFTYGMLNTETRISAYMGIGTGTMPSDVWWRTWRTMPAQFGQRQMPQGSAQTIADPLTGKTFEVVQGHYSYDGIDYVPSWGGSVFEGLMPNLLVPEVARAPRAFGANDVAYLKATIAYDTKALGYKVWGLSPSSTPDDTGNYSAYGSHQLGTSSSDTDYREDAVTPHASFLGLDVLPQAAYRNIEQLQKSYPQVYGPYGFYDALDPVTGTVGHRYLALDHGMILAALNNALNSTGGIGPLQRRFLNDPVGKVVSRYFRAEEMSVTPLDR